MTDRKNFNLDLRPETYWDCRRNLGRQHQGLRAEAIHRNRHQEG
jgi:hypothetical protein